MSPGAQPRRRPSTGGDSGLGGGGVSGEESSDIDESVLRAGSAAAANAAALQLGAASLKPGTVGAFAERQAGQLPRASSLKVAPTVPSPP